jgi:hypothetical protein
VLKMHTNSVGARVAIPLPQNAFLPAWLYLPKIGRSRLFPVARSGQECRFGLVCARNTPNLDAARLSSGIKAQRVTAVRFARCGIGNPRLVSL